jgi:hypothetical protein
MHAWRTSYGRTHACEREKKIFISIIRWIRMVLYRHGIGGVGYTCMGRRAQPAASRQPKHARVVVFYYGQPARPAHTHHGDGGDGSRITAAYGHAVLSSDGNGMDG